MIILKGNSTKLIFKGRNCNKHCREGFQINRLSNPNHRNIMPILLSMIEIIASEDLNPSLITDTAINRMVLLIALDFTVFIKIRRDLSCKFYKNVRACLVANGFRGWILGLDFDIENIGGILSRRWKLLSEAHLRIIWVNFLVILIAVGEIPSTPLSNEQFIDIVSDCDAFSGERGHCWSDSSMASKLIGIRAYFSWFI